MRLYDLLTTVICIIIVILFCCFSSLTRMDFKQVKAGVALGASPRITSDGRADRFAFIQSFA